MFFFRKCWGFVFVVLMVGVHFGFSYKKNGVVMLKMDKNLEKITLGGGCFWCVEAIFQKIKGVKGVVSGYSGGKKANPTYEFVCSALNDYVEVCEVVYDTTILSTEDLLYIFFNVHDPTTLNRQGNDVGYQYRSVIFYDNVLQKAIAQKVKGRVEVELGKLVVTTIEPLKNFYKAEDYHQNYYVNNMTQSYCSYVVKPKLEKFLKMFRDKTH